MLRLRAASFGSEVDFRSQPELFLVILGAAFAGHLGGSGCTSWSLSSRADNSLALSQDLNSIFPGLLQGPEEFPIPRSYIP